MTQLLDHILKGCYKIPVLKKEQEVATTTPFYCYYGMSRAEKAKLKNKSTPLPQKEAFFLIWESAVGFN